MQNTPNTCNEPDLYTNGTLHRYLRSTGSQAMSHGIYACLALMHALIEPAGGASNYYKSYYYKHVLP